MSREEHSKSWDYYSYEIRKGRLYKRTFIKQREILKIKKNDMKTEKSQ